MPDEQRRPQLRQLDEDTPAGRAVWLREYAIVPGVVAIAVVSALFFRRNVSPVLSSDAANAPG